MAVEIFTIGGYDEVGRNMSALKVDDSVIIFDMGFHMQKIVDFEEEGNKWQEASANELMSINAIPNDKILNEFKDNIKAIVIGHCHLDHIGGTVFLAPKYKAPIIGTPYTMEVLKAMLKDDNFDVRNPLITINPNSKYKLSKDIIIEFIHITHSTLQTAMVAVHTKYGIIIYANDYKFDNHPVIGKTSNIERLRVLGKNNVLAIIVDALYSNQNMKTPSEKVARELLKEVLLGTENKDHIIFATTFASNIARLRSIIDFGKKLNRKVVFLGRSLTKYVLAAEKAGIINLSKEVELCAYQSQIKKRLRKIEKEGKNRYLVVCTGSQGEPGSVLNKIVNNILPFEFSKDDHIIFSCKTIPVEPNIKNRKLLEEKLRKRGLRLFLDIHVSGHGSKEDLRDLIELTKPRHIIPSHGNHELRAGAVDLARELGYVKDKNIHLMSNGQKLRIL